MRRVIHVSPRATPLKDSIRFVRFNNIPDDVYGPNLMIDFTASYGGYRDGKGAAQDIIKRRQPSIVILGKEAINAYTYIPSDVQLMQKINATSKTFRRDFKDALDDYRTDTILIDNWENNIQTLKDIDINVTIGKPIYLFELRRDVFAYAHLISTLDMVRGLITAAACNYANHGVILTPNPVATFQLPIPNLEDWTKVEHLGIVDTYNQVCLECWVDGLNPCGFIDFLIGEV